MLVGLFFVCGGITATGWGQSLLVDYAFNAGSGSVAADTGTGTAADGTLQGNAGWTTNTPGGTGSALSLSSGASTDYVTAGIVSKLASLTQFTITMWVNLQAVPNVSDRLLSTLSGSPNHGIDFDINAASSTSFNLSLGVNGVSGGALASSTAGVNAANQWAFVAVTYDGTAGGTASSNVLFYAGSTTASAAQLGAVGTITSGAVAASTGALDIGATAASGSDRTPPAYFDDVRIYSGVLSAAQIDAIQMQDVPEPRTFGLLVFMGGATGMLLLRKRRLA